MSAEGEQLLFRHRTITITRQQQLGGKKRRGHAVAAISKRKKMLRISSMDADVRQAVGCLGTQPVPTIVRLLARQCEINRREVLEKASAPTSEPFSGPSASE